MGPHEIGAYITNGTLVRVEHGALVLEEATVIGLSNGPGGKRARVKQGAIEVSVPLDAISRAQVRKAA